MNRHSKEGYEIQPKYLRDKFLHLIFNATHLRKIHLKSVARRKFVKSGNITKVVFKNVFPLIIYIYIHIHIYI